MISQASNTPEWTPDDKKKIEDYLNGTDGNAPYPFNWAGPLRESAEMQQEIHNRYLIRQQLLKAAGLPDPS